MWSQQEYDQFGGRLKTDHAPSSRMAPTVDGSFGQG